MNELIWIGNTLYPRWVVFAVMIAIPFGLAILIEIFVLRK